MDHASALNLSCETETMSKLTFGIIKPDAVRAGYTGKIIQRILDDGFRLRGLKLIHMSRK